MNFMRHCPSSVPSETHPPHPTSEAFSKHIRRPKTQDSTHTVPNSSNSTEQADYHFLRGQKVAGSDAELTRPKRCHRDSAHHRPVKRSTCPCSITRERPMHKCPIGSSMSLETQAFELDGYITHRSKQTIPLHTSQRVPRVELFTLRS